mmetsp:Transcript_5197/g.13205  ORF Transcript_5197/g.13205 Transcript_5197/m.13205 type:complete len:215 (-) Transcript_5197:311-955(-)
MGAASTAADLASSVSSSPGAAAALRERVLARRRREEAAPREVRQGAPPPLAHVHVLARLAVDERVHHVAPHQLKREQRGAALEQDPHGAEQRHGAGQAEREEYAGGGGDENHAAVPHEQHDTGEDVDVHVFERVLKPQVPQEAVRHGGVGGRDEGRNGKGRHLTQSRTDRVVVEIPPKLLQNNSKIHLSPHNFRARERWRQQQYGGRLVVQRAG